ncbi:TM0106 family RecB-like putative nuclease [Mariniluteicoccus flavus]
MTPPARPVTAEVDRPVVLDAYAARTCAVKTWNRYAPGVEVPRPSEDIPKATGDEGLREGFDGGLSYTDLVLAALLAECRLPVTDLRSLRDAPWAEQESACRETMAAGDPVIVSGLLPRDLVGHRSGRATIWVRGDDTPAGRPGYHPVLVKRRLTTEKKQSGRESTWIVETSTLADPRHGVSFEVEHRTIRTGRDGDLLQLGHYWRLLEAAGHAAAGAARGALIGTDRLPHDDHHIVSWVELEVPMVRTFSRSSETGWTLRSVLERYDHEHGFRVQVAENALSGDAPLVQPIRNRECDSCDWWEVCRPQLGEDDLSVRIDKAPLDVREIQALRALGVRTITDLAGVDLATLKERYLPEVRHRDRAEQRLETAAHRARLMVDQVDLERISTGPIDVPGADLEIDLDIETASDERVYLWGFLVNDTRTDDPPTYHEFSAWHDLGRAEEGALAARAMAWLRGLVEGPASVRVYHYSSYETVRLGQLAQAHDDPTLAWAIDHARKEFVDLFLVMKDHWFGARGLGLKVVATLGAGFEWRDDEPGGLNSQAWFEEACHAADPQARAAARQRVLDYNEDDVRATWRLREWLRSQETPAE